MGRVRDSLLALFGYPTKQRPEQLMDSMIATMSVRLRKCKGQVAIVLASQKRLQEQLHQNMNMTTQYQVKALAAVGRGEDELARELLRKKRRYEDTVEKLKDQLTKHKGVSDRLMETVRLLELKLEETKRNKLLLITQKECYETSQIIEDGFEGEDGDLGFRDILEGIEAEVDHLKYKSEVGVEVEQEALANEPDPLALPESIEEPEDQEEGDRPPPVEGRSSLDDELAALREKLTSNPALLEEAEQAQVLHLVEDDPEPDPEPDEEEESGDGGIQILSTEGVGATRRRRPLPPEDHDEDEEEDDEPPPPPRRRKKAKAPAKKKRAKAAPPPPEDPPDEDEDDGIIFIT